MTNSIAENIKMIYVEEAEIHKLKGKEETDHNTIVSCGSRAPNRNQNHKGELKKR